MLWNLSNNLPPRWLQMNLLISLHLGRGKPSNGRGKPSNSPSRYHAVLVRISQKPKTKISAATSASELTDPNAQNTLKIHLKGADAQLIEHGKHAKDSLDGGRRPAYRPR